MLRFADAEISVEELKVGDVWLDDLIIERKTISDLLSSIADNRLINQASDMRYQSENCYLVICGSLVWTDRQKIVGTDWHFRSVIGALLSVQELGVCVVNAADDDDFPACLNWLLSRDRSGTMTLWPRKYGIPMTAADKILSSLPGIGEVKSAKLLDEYGNLADVIVNLTENNDKIREAFGLAENEYLVKEIRE
jgi:ERCC4-type nuclease